MGAIQTRLLQMLWLDPGEASYAAKVTVWLRWLFWVGAVIELAYRPAFTYAKYIPFMLMHVPLVALNGYVHYRLLSRRRVTWRHLLLLSAMDIALITASVVVDGGFDNFLYIPYYPALAAFAAVFTSALLNLAWTTFTASIYVGVSLTVGSGMAFDGTNEKMLFSRVLAMFGVVLVVNFITRFQRRRAIAAMEREGELQRETDRALRDDSRYGRAVRLHDRPGDRRGQTGCRRRQRGAHRQARCDLTAIQDRRLAAETPDRYGPHIRGRRVGLDPGLARHDVQHHNVGVGGADPERRGAAAFG